MRFPHKFSLVLFSSFILSLPAWADIQVSLVPDNPSPNLGTELSLAVEISGLGSGTALGAYDVSVNFDPTILSYVQTGFGDPALGDQLNLLGLGKNFLATPSTGSVNLIEFSLDDANTLTKLQAGSFTLATLTFDTLATGNAGLAMAVNSLSDASGYAILSYTTQNNSVTVAGGTSTVPLPGGLLLFSSGLLTLLAARRRRH